MSRAATNRKTFTFQINFFCENFFIFNDNNFCFHWHKLTSFLSHTSFVSDLKFEWRLEKFSSPLTLESLNLLWCGQIHRHLHNMRDDQKHHHRIGSNTFLNEISCPLIANFRLLSSILSTNRINHKIVYCLLLIMWLNAHKNIHPHITCNQLQLYATYLACALRCNWLDTRNKNLKNLFLVFFVQQFFFTSSSLFVTRSL